MLPMGAHAYQQSNIIQLGDEVDLETQSICLVLVFFIMLHAMFLGTSDIVLKNSAKYSMWLYAKYIQ